MRPGRAIACGCAILLIAGVAAAPARAGGDRADGPTARSSIIAGEKADLANWPYMAAIFRKGKLLCGGSVIAPQKILTAAHCVFGFNPANLTVVTGRSRFADHSTGQEIPVIAAVPHPDYADIQLHDVGVITLASPTVAPPVTLPTPEEGAALGLAGQPMRVAGWGARNPFGFNLARVLQQTVETVRSNRRCTRAYRKLYSSTAMLCALGRKLKKYGRPFIHATSCSGDSGGPLVYDTPFGAREIGIVSFGGAFCGLGAAPTVYSRVSDALPFIQSQL